MWNHRPYCDCPVCYCLPRIFQLIGTGTGSPQYPSYVAFLGNQLRHLEGELRDEVARRFPGQRIFEEPKAAPPAAAPSREATEVSQTEPVASGSTPPLLLASKVPPPVPPPQLARSGSSLDKADKAGPPVKSKSPRSAERKGTAASSPRKRSRSKRRERSRRPEERRRGEVRSPSPREVPERKKSKDRDRKRRRSSSSRARRSEGGKEKKSHPEKPPEPAYPPSYRGGNESWGPRQPSYPPPSSRGRGWQGELPVSAHPRWTQSENKGQVKRAKQELYNRRYHR